uniref:Uncharacterized protein n=1 Tax=Trypanosoma brucei TaxID=5691 RepID=Q57UE4_9TRYP|nr:hypothetical protein Tb05.5K5.250 [Trypanosoma brucei]
MNIKIRNPQVRGLRNRKRAIGRGFRSHENNKESYSKSLQPAKTLVNDTVIIRKLLSHDPVTVLWASETNHIAKMHLDAANMRRCGSDTEKVPRFLEKAQVRVTIKHSPFFIVSMQFAKNNTTQYTGTLLLMVALRREWFVATGIRKDSMKL